MCGVPYHSSDGYIARLIAKGYKVAICEQTQDPATAKGLVDRDIIRVVTPGTVIDAACLEEGRSNFCAGLYLDDTCAGFSVCDISTGKTHVTAFQGPDRAEHLLNERGRFSPAEAVVNPAAYQCGPRLSLLQDLLHCHVERLSAGRFQLQEAERTVRTQFGDEAACSWEGRSCNGTPVDGFGVGTAFYGETGTLFISGGNEYRIADMGGKTVKEVKSALKFEEGNLLNPSEQLDVIHFRNWFDAIRKGEKLNSGIVDACISTQVVQLGNIAQRVGRSLRIDPTTGRILDDREAGDLWGRTYEKGWEIRV